MEKTFRFEPPHPGNKLTAYIKKYPFLFIMQAAGGIIYNTVVVLGPVMLGRAIDAAQAVYNGSGTLSEFIGSIFLFILVTVIFQFARYFKRLYIRQLANSISCDMRSGLVSAIFTYSMTDLQREKVGDLMSRIIGDVQQVAEVVRKTITEIWDTWLVMLSYLIACLIYSPKITLLAALPIPFVLILAEMIRHPLYRRSLEARKADAKVSSHLRRTISGVSILRLFGREHEEEQRLLNLCEQQMKWNIKMAALQNAMLPLYSLIATLGVLVVFGLGGRLVLSGKWTTGMFTSYLAMFTAMALRTNTAAKVFNGWHSAKASWDRILEKMKTIPEEITEDTAPLAKVECVSIQNLSFSFPGSTRNAVQNINLEAKTGQIIGITGAVGSGKSALACALSGLFPYDGSVRIDGKELSELGDSRPSVIAYMNQEQFLFSGDIRSNIELDKPGGADRLSRSIYTAALETDIAQFPNGLDTKVGERGVQISGGQRQRVSLARALNSGAPILLLDDPFSALDIDTEQKMITRLRENCENRIIFLFSHRLAAFEMADHILVLDHGNMIQQGTHQKLMEEDGIYRQIFHAQRWMRGANDE